MDWRKKELDKLLREEFDKRGFYLVNSEPIEWAPRINGFKKHSSMVKYLMLESNDYEYVAYKNMSVTVGNEGSGMQEIASCLFIKVGARRKAEVNPMVELVTFYQGRMYKHVGICRSFFFRIGYVRSTEELKDVTNEIWESAALIVNNWLLNIRTLIVENRWPEEEYISDLKFLEDEEL